MASGSFTGSTSNQYITPRIVWSTVTHVNTNTSDLTATFQLKKSSSLTAATSGTGRWTIELDGKKYNFNKNVTLTTNDTWITIYSKTIYGISHNDDGTKTSDISLTGSIPNTIYSSTTIKQTVSFDTIPRASTVSSFKFTNGYIDQGIDITISAKVSSYYHDIHLYTPDTSGTGIVLIDSTVGRKSGGTHHISLSDEQVKILYGTMPTTTSAKFTIYVRTYSSATSTTAIGEWQTAVATGNISKNVVPTISASAVIASGGLNGYYVQGKSTCKITASGTPGLGSNIVSYTFSGDNMTSSSKTSTIKTSTTSCSATTSIIKTSGTIGYNVTVQDARGRTASTPISITVYSYATPQITSASVQRCDSSGVLNANGTYAKYTVNSKYSPISVSGTINNSRTVTIAYSSDGGSTYSTATTIQDSANISDSATGIYGSDTFNTTSSYKIKFVIKDNYNATSTYILDLATAERIMNIKSDGKGIGFGTISEGSGIETPWNIKFKGSGEKALIFENGSSSGWKTQLYQGNTSSSTALGVWDSTNQRTVWEYNNDGNFYINRPVILNGGMDYVSIAANTDLNTMKSAGFYKCPNDTTAKTLSNCPTELAFSLVIENHAGVKQTLTVYTTDGNPIIYIRNYYNGTWGFWGRLSYNAEHSTIWTGAVTYTTTITLNEDFHNFRFLTCILGTSSEPYGIVLGAFWDYEIAELYFSASFTKTAGFANDDIFGAKFVVNSGTSLKLIACATAYSSSLYVRKIVGWR